MILKTRKSRLIASAGAAVATGVLATVYMATAADEKEPRGFISPYANIPEPAPALLVPANDCQFQPTQEAMAALAAQGIRLGCR